jgi:hypothetical protein
MQLCTKTRMSLGGRDTRFRPKLDIQRSALPTRVLEIAKVQFCERLALLPPAVG